jgi:hypothetical protein
MSVELDRLWGKYLPKCKSRMLKLKNWQKRKIFLERMVFCTAFSVDKFPYLRRIYRMPDLALDKIKPAAANKIGPLLEELLREFRERIHSIHITGTAVTDDFNEKVSDVNSVVVLREMHLGFLKSLAPLGKKHGKRKVAAPLIMTPDYIRSSLDVFPIEFLNFKYIHVTVFGEDIFKDLIIDRMDLRHQCERDLKTKVLGLRQLYISSQGDKRLLSERFISSITGYIPLFRGIIALYGKVPPVRQSDVITMLAAETGISPHVFKKVLQAKHQQIKLTIDELNTIFEDYYAITERLGTIVDEIKE